jgi:hypothetical protein
LSPWISISSWDSSGEANTILLKFPVPLLGSNVTVNLFELLGPTKQVAGSILKAESFDGSGSNAFNSNLNGFSALSNAKFFTISISKMSSYSSSMERAASC